MAWPPLSWLIDGIIAITLVEAVWLWAYRRRTGKGVRLAEVGANLVSGLCLMVALRTAVTGGPVPAILACLTLSGLAHGADLWRRWQR